MDRGMGTGQEGEPSGASPLREPSAQKREIRLKRLMAFFMQELQDSRKPMREDSDIPDHECGFLTQPDTGYCAFCDSWGEAFEALEARSAPEAASAEGSQPPFPTLDRTMRVLLSYLDGGPANAPYDEYRALETAIAEWMGRSPSHPSGPSQDSGPSVSAHWLMTQCNIHLLDGAKNGAVRWSDGLQVIATKAAEAVAASEAK